MLVSARRTPHSGESRSLYSPQRPIPEGAGGFNPQQNPRRTREAFRPGRLLPIPVRKQAPQPQQNRSKPRLESAQAQPPQRTECHPFNPAYGGVTSIERQPQAPVPGSWQSAHSSQYQRLCPIHRSFITMSGFSDKAAKGLRWPYALWPEAVPESGGSSLSGNSPPWAHTGKVNIGPRRKRSAFCALQPAIPPPPYLQLLL